MRSKQEVVDVATNEFLLVLQHLIKKECWGFVAGKGTGSVIVLDFGNKMKRDRPLKNPHLTQEQRENSAELSLLVQCAWRLDANDRVVCGAWDSNEVDGPMLTGLQEIVDRAVCSVVADVPSMDLTLRFDGGMCLKVFCDHVNVDEAEDNYIFYTPTRTFIVGTRSHLSVQFRATKEPGAL